MRQTQHVTAPTSAPRRAPKPRCPRRCRSRELPASGRAPQGWCCPPATLRTSLEGVRKERTPPRQLSAPQGTGLEVHNLSRSGHAPGGMHLNFPPLPHASSTNSFSTDRGKAPQTLPRLRLLFSEEGKDRPCAWSILAGVSEPVRRPALFSSSCYPRQPARCRGSFPD